MKRFVGFLSLMVLLLNSVLMPLTYAQGYQDEILGAQVNNTVGDSSNVENANETEGEQNEEAEDASQFPVIEENSQEPEITPVDEPQDEDQEIPSESTLSGGLEGSENTNQEGANGVGSGNDLDETLGSGDDENLNVQTGADQVDDMLSGALISEQLASSGDVISPDVGSGNIEDLEEDLGILSSVVEAIEGIFNSIRYFFVKDNSEYIGEYKQNGVKVISLKDPVNGETITIMDRNLGAEDNDITSEDSYGNYYQWGNNNGFEKVDGGNVTSNLAVYSLKYEGIGYTRDNKFRVGSNDIWEVDEEGRSNYDELWYLGENEEIQGPCPEGYHVPSDKEWNKLVRIWTKIHTLDENEGGKIVRSVKGDTLKASLEQAGTGDAEENTIEEENLTEVEELFMKELKLPKAGNYATNGEREDGLGIYWSRTPSDKPYQSEVFSLERYFGEDFDENLLNRANGNSVRCFLDTKDKEELVEYNKEEITGEKRYDGVTVSVYAGTGFFPEGTKLEISAIKEVQEINDIKDQVSEENELKEDAKLVAFDISFIYKGEEVQPLEGKVVKVTFDYSNNDELSESDKIDEQEVKVFHIDDKDEEGNKVEKGEEIVKEVTNIEESEEDGVVVADAESFSVYAIVTVTGAPESVVVRYNLNGGYWIEDGSIQSKDVTYLNRNGIYKATEFYRTPSKTGFMFMGWFDNGGTNRRDGVVTDNVDLYAKWQEFGDLDVYILGTDSNKYHYTLMDRNMGATAQLQAGYYYQWGNSFGFIPGSISTTGNTINVSDFSWQIPYYYNLFVAKQSNQDWMEERNMTLRGGNDSILSHKQGPCPEGYHVPTENEWSDAKTYWIKYKSTERANSEFATDFMFKGHGYISRNDGKFSNTSEVRYLTSTLKNQDKGVRVLSSLDGSIQDEWFANGRSLRCFKDEFNEGEINLSDFYLNGGENAIITVISGVVQSIQKPYKNFYDFDGWYTSSDFSGDPIEVGSTLLPGSSLYAKWIAYDSYTITYDLNGGFMKYSNNIRESNIEEYAENTNSFTLKNPVKLNSVFLGWSGTNLSSPTLTVTIPKGSKGNRVYEALYECEPGYVFDEDNNCVGVRNADGTLNFDEWEYGTVDFGVGDTKITMLDRNLGASTNDISDSGSLGFYYKWGNNYGFSTNHTSKYGATNTKIADISGYGPGALSGYYLSHDWIYGGEKSAAGHWSSIVNFDLWGDITDTLQARQGPCPDEYHIPSDGEVSSVIKILSEFAGTSTGIQCVELYGNKRKCFQNLVKLPDSGLIKSNSSTSSVSDTNRIFLWTSSDYNNATMTAFHSTQSQIDMTIGERSSAAAMQVRCFKNIDKVKVKYNFNGGYYGDNIYSKPDIEDDWWNLSKQTISPLNLSMKRENSIFSGWYLDSQFKKPFTGGTILPYATQNTTFYARWECNSGYGESQDGNSCIKDLYTVTITSNNENYGTVSSGFVSVQNGVTVTTSGNELTIGNEKIFAAVTGSNAQYTYQFSGWNNTCGETIVSNCSIEAEFTRTLNSYTITFHSNGGSTVDPQTKEYGTIGDKPENPTRDGYDFNGWYSNSGLTIEYHFTEVIEGNVDLYAKWSPITYTITYEYNNGTGSNPETYQVDTPSFTLNNPTRTGYTFIGWSGTELEGLDNTNVTIVIGSVGDREYEANWEANKYNVTYKANGGEGEDVKDEAIYDEHYEFLSNSFEKTGYSFVEWNTKSDGTGTGYTEGFSGIWKTATGVNLYAIWEINKYIVTYDAASHSGTINNQPTKEEFVVYNTSITLPSSGITSQKGYEFTGWTTTLNGKEPISNNYTVTGDITFYPIFKKDGEQKDITFHKNGNSGYRYENHEYTEDKAFSGCSIPTLYNTDADIVSCSVHITLPDIIAHENTPTVLGWSTGAEERTISYATGVVVTIIIPRGKEVELYAQTRSVEKEYTATYKTDSRVEEVEEPSDTCRVPVTYNGNPQQITCTGAITLPNILAKLGYNTPIWKLGETEYDAGSQVYLSGNVIFTATATPDAHTPYTVKHYYQIGDTDYYDFSGYDTLSGATETLLELSKLQKNPLENTGFTYYKARVNDESDDPIDIGNIDDLEEAEIQPGLVIQLFYTRNNNTLTLNTIEHAIVEKSPTGDNYYYGEAITFSGHAEEGYTFSGWSIKEGGNAPQTILGTQINYTMPSTGVVVTPVIREHSYTIHFDGNGAVGNIADQSTLYSETVILPTAEQVAEQLTNTGHHFVGWTTGATETTVLTELSKAITDDNGEVSLYAKWDVNDGTQYLVKYYLEPVEEGKPQSEYFLQDTFTGAAPTNSVITGVLKNYDGFTTPLELTGKVAADGSLVIKYYYTRNSYTYTFNAGEGAEFEDGTDSTGLSFRYEQAVNEPGLSVVKPGFTKIGWTPELSVTMPHENKTSTVVWSENHYTIEYDANGGDGETPTQSNIAYTESITLTGNQFVKEGYYFAGWSITKDGEVKYIDKAVVSGLTGVNNAVVKLYAHWEANGYTVTFDANSGDVSGTEKNVIYDSVYGELPEANRVGYTFNGWFTEKVSGVEITENTKVTRAEDHTLYAHWTANKYIVTFNANGGVVSQSAGEVIFDEEYGVLPTPTRIGYTFVGWYTEEPDSVKVTKNTKVTRAEDHTLYAHWTANKYIVTFNANEGVVSQSTGEVTYNQSYGVLPLPTREGYSFSGWYTQAEGGEYVTGTTTVTRAENHTLYAQWKANTYTVTFDANSGDVSETPRQVTFDEEYGVLPVATRTGYTFQGWYTEKDGGDNITGTTKVTIASNHTLYAHWLENHYTIKFNVNGGVGEMSSMTDIKYTDEVKLTKNTFTRNGYQFNGRSKTTDGVKVYDDEQDVTKLTGENNATVTLYAVWQKGSYNITYDLNGGALAGGKTNPVGYDVDTETFTLNNPERDGYDFLGWSGTEIDGLSTLVIIANGSTGDRVYEANWKATKYRITYNLVGGELPSGKKNPEEYTIESGNFTFVNPTREGYDFLGWSGTDLTGLTKSVIIFQGSTGDREYEANWEVKTYTITWKNSTGDVLETDENVEYGTMPSYDGEEPTSGGNVQYTYTFSGWTPATGMVVGDQVYTATYTSEVNKYTIKFVNEDGTELQNSEVEYGKNPKYTGATPTKAADAQYTYTFSGWTPATGMVVGDQVYTATYTSEVNKYAITFVNEDGTELQESNVEYGDTPEYRGTAPTKSGDAQYTYTFTGWTPEIHKVTGSQVYTATYERTVNKYPVTFYDEDGVTVLKEAVLYPYGTVSGDIIKPSDPTKASDGTYNYTFKGWSPEIEIVVGTANYTATYESSYIDYQVIFLDSTGAVLTSGYYHSGDTITSIPAGPAKASTAQTGYTFKSWYPEVQVVTGNIIYEPTYTETTRSYTIIWKDRNGTELEKDENVVYGADPQYDGVEPTSGATIQYTYTFNGWLPGVHSVTGPEVYTASYVAELRSYPITFYDEDGVTVVKATTMYPYGTPSTIYKPLTNPTKEGYSFEKWIPELEAVVGTADYKASYKINSYKVTPVKGVGIADIIGGGTYEYNTVVTLTGYAKAGYHFEGGETVKGFNVTVPADSISVKITADPNTYYIHYKPNGGTGVMLDQVFVYDQEQELSANAYTNEGKYFKEWTDGEGHQYKDKSKVKNLVTTGVINLIAIWTETPEPPIPPTPPTPTPTPSPGETAAGGGRIITPVEEEHESADLQTGTIVQTGDDVMGEDTQGETGYSTRTEEEMDAYKYAYKYHITTLAPREAAMPDDYVQRGHMAKMVVNYSLNVLHRKLPEKIPDYCKWNNAVDSFESQEIKEYAEKSCALGIMGIDMNYFQPNKYVTRAQFGTIFGRLLRGKLPSTPYYAAHLAGLKERGIMTQIENPEDRIEIRKWAWLMFMRSEKYFNIKK